MARLQETQKLIHSEAWRAARRYNIQDREDLVSAGQEAVIKFHKRYNPNRGAQFITGAHQVIRTAIQREAARQHLVRVPEHALGKVTKAQKLPQRRSLTALSETSDEGGIPQSEHLLTLRSLSKNLTEQQLKVISLNLKGYKHAEIAKKLRISPTRAQNLYNQAFKKMQKQSQGGRHAVGQ